MNKTVVTSVAIVAVGVVLCFYVYAANNRYKTVNAGEGRVYRVDARTGESVLLYGNREVPVVGTKPRNESAEEAAIRLAKAGHSFGPNVYSDNDTEIRQFIKQRKGDLKIIGWQARKVDDQTFVVTYSLDPGSGPRSYAFEVNTEAEVVRNIIGDPVLERKYGFGQQQASGTSEGPTNK